MGLLKDIAGIGVGSGRVYPGFAVRSGDTDALVFQYTTETTHRMTLEMGEVYHKVVICKVAANKIFCKPLCILHRKVHASFLIHDVNRSYLAITSLLYGTTVISSI